MKLIHNKKSYQQGMGMTEVLVAMLLLGIGVIGFAALQVRALTASHDAAFRSQASAIARDVLERMRVNPTEQATYTNNALWIPTGTPDFDRDDSCETGDCDATALANYDIVDIANIANSTLPNGRVNVRQCQNRTNTCVYVSWNATSPTVGNTAPNCVNDNGLYVTVTAPNKTDCIVSEG